MKALLKILVPGDHIAWGQALFDGPTQECGAARQTNEFDTEGQANPLCVCGVCVCVCVVCVCVCVGVVCVQKPGLKPNTNSLIISFTLTGNELTLTLTDPPYIHAHRPPQLLGLRLTHAPTAMAAGARSTMSGCDTATSWGSNCETMCGLGLGLEATTVKQCVLFRLGLRSEAATAKLAHIMCGSIRAERSRVRVMQVANSPQNNLYRLHEPSGKYWIIRTRAHPESRSHPDPHPDPHRRR